MRRLSISAAGALVVALLLSACAEPLPEPTPEARPAVAAPAVDVEQVERALADLGEVLAAADEQRSAEALEPRVAGAAARTRQAQYALAQAGVDDTLTAIPTQVQTVVTPVVEGWPRTVMTVTEPPADATAPLLLTLVQDSPRDQYRLVGWSRLFPQTQTPPLAQPEIGSPSATDLELVAPLDDVLPRYLDVVLRGEESEHAAQFPQDPLRTGIEQARAAYQGLTTETGLFDESYAPEEASVHALATAEGGAVVTAAFTTTTSIVLEDSTMTVDAATAAFLGGDTELEDHLTITWLSMVTFHVPPAGSDRPVQVLGGEHTRVAAEGA